MLRFGSTCAEGNNVEHDDHWDQGISAVITTTKACFRVIEYQREDEHKYGGNYSQGLERCYPDMGQTDERCLLR